MPYRLEMSSNACPLRRKIKENNDGRKSVWNCSPIFKNIIKQHATNLF